MSSSIASANRSLRSFYNSDALEAVAITVDADWAPECVLADLVGRLRDHGLCATVFATNPSACLAEAATEGVVELAWHPNFAEGSSQGSTPQEICRNLRTWFPDALGTRSHRLVQSTDLLRQQLKHGIRYDANLLLPGQAYLEAFRTFFGLLRIPYCWSDAYILGLGSSFTVPEMLLESPGLKVLSFHPHHVYLNSTTWDAYNRLRSLGTPIGELDASELAPFVQRGSGIGSLFQALCASLREREIGTYFLREFVSRFDDEAPTEPAFGSRPS